jgi:hypothetical protein
VDNFSVDGWQAFIAVLWPFVQQWMKNNNSPMLEWISDETRHLNIGLSAVIAALTTVGFHLMGDAQHGWTLYIPPVTVLGHVAAQWLGQHVVYSTAIKGPEMQKAMLEELQKLNGSGK